MFSNLLQYTIFFTYYVWIQRKVVYLLWEDIFLFVGEVDIYLVDALKSLNLTDAYDYKSTLFYLQFFAINSQQIDFVSKIHLDSKPIYYLSLHIKHHYRFFFVTIISTQCMFLLLLFSCRDFSGQKRHFFFFLFLKPQVDQPDEKGGVPKPGWIMGSVFCRLGYIQ